MQKTQQYSFIFATSTSNNNSDITNARKQATFMNMPAKIQQFSKVPQGIS